MQLQATSRTHCFGLYRRVRGWGAEFHVFGHFELGKYLPRRGDMNAEKEHGT